MFLSKTPPIHLFFSLLCCFFLYQLPLSACGYNFVGGCSTHIGVQINGTRDSLAVDACAIGTSVNGLQLGNIRSLRLRSANAITWESCINNVTGVEFYCRVYEKNGTPGAWKKFTLGDDSIRVEGPYTSRYRTAYFNEDITAGLIQGKTYQVDMYFMAQVDTIGDDFVPETTLMQNNNGQNYSLYFQYGGSSAPPFSTIVTRREPALCNGDSSGVAGVTLFGDAQNVRYAWSSSPDNYHTIFHLRQGTYTVTVTSSNASPQVRSITVMEPSAVTATFSNIEPAGCNNRPGMAIVSASGGTPTYQYFWESGTVGPEGTLPTAGNWKVTVRDANYCTRVFAVQIPMVNTIAERSMQAEICRGEVFSTNGLSFSRTGRYQFSIPNQSGCDTLVTLNLKVVSPDSAFAIIPDSARIVCVSPSIDICAITMPGATFKWEKSGILLSNSNCYTIQSGGDYLLTSTIAGNTKVCAATKKITIEANLLPPVINVQADPVLFICKTDSASLQLKVQTGAKEPHFAWNLNGTTIGSAASVQIRLPLTTWATARISLVVTDKYGCSAFYEHPLLVITPPSPLILNAATLPASAVNAANGAVNLTVFGGSQPYRYTWNTGATTASLMGVLPGIYCVTVTDANGCSVATCQQVTISVANKEIAAEAAPTLYPNPCQAGSVLTIQWPEQVPYKSAEWQCVLQDIRGKTVQTTVLNTATPTIAVPAGLPPGIYVLALQNDHFRWNTRVLVQ
jgi:hypothetical protein